MASLQAAAAAAAADVQNRPPRNLYQAGKVPPTKALPAKPPIVIDREKTCPLLLRVFPKMGGHHRVEDFGDREPKDEVQIYTWKDASLRELTELIKEVQPFARRRGARLSFAFIYPDRKGRNVMRQVGVTQSSPRQGLADDNKTLDELSFQTGDLLDVAIFT